MAELLVDNPLLTLVVTVGLGHTASDGRVNGGDAPGLPAAPSPASGGG